MAFCLQFRDTGTAGFTAQLVAEGLLSLDHPTQQRFVGCSGVELRDDRVDQTRDLGEESSIVPEERSKRLWHREDELPVRQVQKNLIRQMLCCINTQRVVSSCPCGF